MWGPEERERQRKWEREGKIIGGRESLRERDGAFERIEDYADSKGLTLLGYFHSHPDSPAVPSEFDRVHALPFFAYIIVSVQSGKTAETRLWELVTDRSHFIEGQLMILTTQEQ